MNERFGDKVKAIFDSITVLQAKDSDLKEITPTLMDLGAMLQYGATLLKNTILNI